MSSQMDNFFGQFLSSAPMIAMTSSGKNRLLRRLTLVGLVLGALAGSLALTNPSRSAYERYATQRLSTYLSQNVCDDLPAGLGNLLRQQCRQVLTANQGTFQAIIQSNTRIHNYGLFSLYYTRFAVPNFEMLPTYEVETVGIFNQFFTYKAQQQGELPVGQ